MQFSKTSDVTVVITCCGRLELLRKTLESFSQHNTYPINHIIITEDAGNEGVYSAIPIELKEHCTVIINHEKLGQIRSIDKAYSLVETGYIFHCEEDWQFYRKGFIEDSKTILEANPQAYQVWLRSFYHDIHRDYPFHTLGEDLSTGSVSAYRLLSSNPKWQGFSFNPGLRRLSDYQAITQGYSSLFDERNSSSIVESKISAIMKSCNMYAAVLENDAVAHIGYGHHINDKNDSVKKLKKKAKHLALTILVFSSGWLAAGL